MRPLSPFALYQHYTRHCYTLFVVGFLSGRLWSGRGISLGVMTCVYWLTVRSRGHSECGVVAGRRLILRSIGGLVVMLSVCRRKLNKYSMSGAKLSWQMYQIHRSGGQQLSGGLWCELHFATCREQRRIAGLGQQMKRPHCFRHTLTPTNVKIVFSNRIHVTAVQC